MNKVNKVGWNKVNMAISLAAFTLLSACGGSDSDSSNDVETEVNQVPTVSAGEDLTVDENTSVTLAGSASDSDGTISSYAWTQSSGTSVTLDSTTSDSVSFTAPDVDSDETLVFTLTVTDDAGDSSSDSVSVTVTDLDSDVSAPTANAGTDQVIIVNSTVTLNGEQSTSGGEDTLTYLWSFIEMPTGSSASLSDTTAEMPEFVADVVGTYTIELVVDNGVVSSDADSVQVTVQEQATGTVTTDGILCDYDYNEFNDSASVQLTSSAQWSCVDGERVLVANGIPDHEVGEFPNSGNPNTISEQSVSANYTLTPEETGTASELGGPRGPTGYVLNGVKIDASTAGSCEDLGENCSLVDNSGSWNIEALGHSSFDFGTDDNNAHVQPEGTYHYHGMPEGFITLQGGSSETITLIGWAADGFPIYARYGYSEANNPCLLYTSPSPRD